MANAQFRHNVTFTTSDGTARLVKWKLLPHAYRMQRRRADQLSRVAGFAPHTGGKPRKSKPTPKTTSLSRGQSAANWARLLLRHGPAA